MERLVNLSEITQEKPITRTLLLNEAELELPKEEVSSASQFTLNVRIAKKAIGYTVSGRIKGSLNLICARCGQPFKKDIDETFSFELMPSSTIENGMIRSDELDVRFYNSDILNLTEIAREQILLSLPVKPLCGRKPILRGWSLPNEGRALKSSAIEKLKVIKDKLSKRRENGGSKEEIIKHKKG